GSMMRLRLRSNGYALPNTPSPPKSLNSNNGETPWILSSSLGRSNKNWSGSFTSAAPKRFLKTAVIHNLHSFPQRFTERKKDQKRKNEGLLLRSRVTFYFAR